MVVSAATTIIVSTARYLMFAPLPPHQCYLGKDNKGDLGKTPRGFVKELRDEVVPTASRREIYRRQTDPCPPAGKRLGRTIPSASSRARAKRPLSTARRVRGSLGRARDDRGGQIAALACGLARHDGFYRGLNLRL